MIGATEIETKASVILSTPKKHELAVLYER